MILKYEIECGLRSEFILEHYAEHGGNFPEPIGVHLQRLRHSWSSRLKKFKIS